MISLYSKMFILPFFASGKKPKKTQLYFWRNTNPKFYDGLKKFAEVADIPLSNTRVVYSGDDSYRGENQKFISWKEIE